MIPIIKEAQVNAHSLTAKPTVHYTTTGMLKTTTKKT
jgi:hypothetical protein